MNWFRREDSVSNHHAMDVHRRSVEEEQLERLRSLPVAERLERIQPGDMVSVHEVFEWTFDVIADLRQRVLDLEDKT